MMPHLLVILLLFINRAVRFRAALFRIDFREQLCGTRSFLPNHKFRELLNVRLPLKPKYLLVFVAVSAQLLVYRVVKKHQRTVWRLIISISLATVFIVK